MELILENIRCFVGRHTIPVKPLTVLIGENSSGKTTFLAALSIVCNTRDLLESANFNESPYSLGVFDTIATSQNGKRDRAKYFSLGRIDKKGEEKIAAEMVATFRNNQGQAQLYELSAEGLGNSLTVWLDETGNKYRYKYTLGDRKEEGNYPIRRKPFDTDYLVALYVFIIDLLPVIKPLSIAPVRTKPKRTYDEFIERFNPEGDDIPFVLARILNGKPKSKQE